jgi:hypothetical protein
MIPDVELCTVAVEDLLEPGKALTNSLGHLHAQRSGIWLGPGVDAQARQVAPQRRNAASMARPSQNAFVRCETPGTNTEVDEGAAVGGRKPDDAGPTVGARGWIIGVDQSGVGDTALARVREAYASRRDVGSRWRL